jgi:hypothetical protein
MQKGDFFTIALKNLILKLKTKHQLTVLKCSEVFLSSFSSYRIQHISFSCSSPLLFKDK